MKKPGIRYFGPYAHAWAIRETVDQLLRVFPMRSCSKGVFVRHQRMGRPCLLGDIGKCAAPCVGRVDEQEHREIAEELCRFLGGRTEKYIRDIERQMTRPPGNSTTRLPPDCVMTWPHCVGHWRALRLFSRMTPMQTSLAWWPTNLRFQLGIPRPRGRVTGQRSFIVERTVDGGEDELVEQFVTQLYGEDSENQEEAGVPQNVIVSQLPPNVEVLTSWLSAKRGAKVRFLCHRAAPSGTFGYRPPERPRVTCRAQVAPSR